MPNRAKLLQEAFNKLLAWLDVDRERAGEKYATLHKKLVTIFQSRGFSPAEKHADEVLDRMARRLDDSAGRPAIQTNDPETFALGIARTMIAFESNRRPEAKEDSFEDWMQEGGEKPSGNLETEYIVAAGEEQRKKCLERCWGRCLKENEQVLLRAYYEFEALPEHPLHSDLAKQLGITEGSLRSRVSRTKQKLSDCVQNCMRNQ